MSEMNRGEFLVVRAFLGLSSGMNFGFASALALSHGDPVKVGILVTIGVTAFVVAMSVFAPAHKALADETER